MLSDVEVVGIVRKHIESKFPKECAVCGRRFASLAEYLRGTKHVGDPVSGDSIDKPLPTRPVGTISFASCPCGSTLVISSAGLDVFTMRNLMKWARRGRPSSEFRCGRCSQICASASTLRS